MSGSSNDARSKITFPPSYLALRYIVSKFWKQAESAEHIQNACGQIRALLSQSFAQLHWVLVSSPSAALQGWPNFTHPAAASYHSHEFSQISTQHCLCIMRWSSLKLCNHFLPATQLALYVTSIQKHFKDLQNYKNQWTEIFLFKSKLLIWRTRNISLKEFLSFLSMACFKKLKYIYFEWYWEKLRGNLVILGGISFKELTLVLSYGQGHVLRLSIQSLNPLIQVPKLLRFYQKFLKILTVLQVYACFLFMPTLLMQLCNLWIWWVGGVVTRERVEICCS